MNTERRVIKQSGRTINMYVLTEDKDQVIAIIDKDNVAQVYLAPNTNKDIFKTKPYVKLIAVIKKRHGVAKVSLTNAEARITVKE